MVVASATPSRPFARAQTAATLAGLVELVSDPKEKEEEGKEEEGERKQAESEAARNSGGNGNGETEAPPELPQLPPEGGGSAAVADPAFLERLHRLERHIRSGRLRLTFADELGRAAAAADGAAAGNGGGGGARGSSLEAASPSSGGAATAASSSSSTKSARVKTQARRLAFYLFWNVSGDVTR